MSDKPKRYLLIRGSWYYPRSRTRDWVGCYETEEEAQAALTTEFEKDDHSREFEDEYMWSTIVDLYQWLYSTKEQAPNE